MKIDPTNKKSLFKQVLEESSTIDPPVYNDIVISDPNQQLEDLVSRINDAIADRNLDSLPWLQLEVLTTMLVNFKMIDWRLSEILEKINK